MPAAVPAIPPNPRTAAIIAITKNVNAQLNIMILQSMLHATQMLVVAFLHPNSEIGHPDRTNWL